MTFLWLVSPAWAPSDICRRPDREWSLHGLGLAGKTDQIDEDLDSVLDKRLLLSELEKLDKRSFVPTFTSCTGVLFRRGESHGHLPCQLFSP